MQYTLVYHDLLEHFDLSMPEYALVYLIDGLSAQNGWCFASREEMAKRVRMGSRWVFNSLHQLTEKGLVEVDEKSRFIRASKAWKDAFRKCQKEGGLPTLTSEPDAELDIEALYKIHKRNIQLKYRESVHNSSDGHAQATHVQPIQEPVNSLQTDTEQNQDTMPHFHITHAKKDTQPMQSSQSSSVQTMNVPVKDMHTTEMSKQTGSEIPTEASGTIMQLGSEQTSEQLMYLDRLACEPNAHYNNIYSNSNNYNYKNKNNNNTITEKSACAQDFQFSNQEEFSQKEKAGEKLENFLKSEEQNQTVVEAAIVTPPQVAPAPSPKKDTQSEGLPILKVSKPQHAGQQNEPMQNVHSLKTDSKATPVDPCLVPCREGYLRQFVAYKWVYGRDDKFLKQVLEQIRYKIAVQWQQPDLNLAEIPDESVIHSFQSLLEKIPTWYRDNGHTTPNDLNRFFEKYYAAIKSGNGGGDRGPFAPLQDQEYETVQLLLQSRGRHNR
ncbi:hypothetical protein [Xanthocytophaga flava]|uniref:hypothetical protein n=1 Tax=Xanthocytophaga flava TaxID=3048013 RepID=UPI0028D3E7D8|nr:hypothetical protein [Xanthocytophaga flavus]MDJ1466956.1 hypothetical protein [Xanthocytophaga flavus]